MLNVPWAFKRWGFYYIAKSKEIKLLEFRYIFESHWWLTASSQMPRSHLTPLKNYVNNLCCTRNFVPSMQLTSILHWINLSCLHSGGPAKLFLYSLFACSHLSLTVAAVSKSCPSPDAGWQFEPWFLLLMSSEHLLWCFFKGQMHSEHMKNKIKW